MVVFDVDHSPSLRRHDHQEETVDVTMRTTPPTTATATTGGSISGTDPTAVTTARTQTPTMTMTNRNGGAAITASTSLPSPSSSSTSRMSPTIPNQQVCLKRSGNTNMTTASSSIDPASPTTISSHSSLSSMEIEEHDNNNNRIVLVDQQLHQPRQQLQRQAAHQQHHLLFSNSRRVSFASTNVVTVINDDPVLFTDYEKSVCFCSVSERQHELMNAKIFFGLVYIISFFLTDTFCFCSCCLWRCMCFWPPTIYI
jgi:hypothetical protein